MSYKELLDIFWSSHTPTSSSKRQYRAVIWTHNKEQQKQAELSLDCVKKRCRRSVKTTVEVATDFTLAEEYHQHYILKHTMGVKFECPERPVITTAQQQPEAEPTLPTTANNKCGNDGGSG